MAEDWQRHDPRSYGAELDGVADDTIALTRWAAAGGYRTFPALTARITASIPLISDTTIVFAQGALLTTAVPGISLLKAVSRENIHIRGGIFRQTRFDSAAHIGLIELTACTHCTVENIEGIGMQWGGVLLNGSQHCSVRGCSFHDWLGSVPDSADISVYRNSSYNTIADNTCYGGGQHGIMLQDPGGSAIPMRNTVTGNRVGPHSSYGILLYNNDHAGSYSTVENNEVEGITGTDLHGNAGAGIYIMGAGAVLVANNTVRNCCLKTTVNTLTPAGIGLNLDPGLAPVTVRGNVILDIANFYGIEVVHGPAIVTGNTVRFSSGAGANIGIYLNNASRTIVHENNIWIDVSIPNGHGIFAFASEADLTDIVITNNFVRGTSVRGIRVDTTREPRLTNVVVNGNNVMAGGVASIPFHLANMTLASVTGNVGMAGPAIALSLDNCTQTLISSNVLTSTGAAAVVMSGTNTGTCLDQTNFVDARSAVSRSLSLPPATESRGRD
jgi:parallel beta-helix repeat protein